MGGEENVEVSGCCADADFLGAWEGLTAAAVHRLLVSNWKPIKVPRRNQLASPGLAQEPILFK